MNGRQQIIHAQVEVNRANWAASKDVPDPEYILVCLDNAIRDLREARKKLRRRLKLKKIIE